MNRSGWIGMALALGACRSARTEAEDVLPDLPLLVGEEYVAGDSRGAASESGEGTFEEWDAVGWWQRFEDPVLDELIQAVLAGNLDLRRAGARVQEAEARARAARGGRGPQADVAFAAGRRVDNLEQGDRLYTGVYVPQVSVAWQADLFGRLAAVERSRVAETFASAADRLALAHTLVAQTARLRVEISVLERRLALAQDIVRSRTGTLETVEGRFERGVSSASAVDVYQARENLAAARTALPATERALEQDHLVLDVLLGRKPGSGDRLRLLAAPLPAVDPPPTGVPVALLDRRPDLTAARLRLDAAAAEVDVSLAALYPDLTLSASAGLSAGSLGDLFSVNTFFADLIAGLTAPLFTSGRLRADVDVAHARLEGLASEYVAAVLQAVREVEDALVAERRLREELVERTRQLADARMAEDLARERYGRGLESLLTVLDTERRRTAAEDETLRLQAAVWNARIDLHLALGGDWALGGDRALAGEWGTGGVGFPDEELEGKR